MTNNLKIGIIQQHNTDSTSDNRHRLIEKIKSLATKGAAAIESGTMVASVPIAVPRIRRDRGINSIIRIMKGKLLRILTILERIVFTTLIGLKPPCSSESVICRIIPRGSPIRTENTVEKNTIMRVSIVDENTISNILLIFPPPL